ncbi:hypothetical protein SmB9_11630 [Sphingosinicella microcystinivorans]|uniref:DUF4139 domain-containing protein n=1 Tax=Sphingosinicella microcystinivorans TaxID=335406 RepID=A0AAD1G0B9_SPHMI|nr:hypothetical protein DFR51_0129 [Sphingosinicella microcystinivorans]BBE33505.1 hypothetical protein SmB9_11630 [Sphingosinicella microcystinivorans]
MRVIAPLLLLLGWAAPAPAATVVSREVSDVAVTIYRAPGRSSGALDRAWPAGYALISETRTITIPAGDSIVRFEGVAEGLLPETAIVTGLPEDVREKNRDARLVSPAGLVDAFLKRRVTLQRTNRQTGKVTKQDAIIQAGPNGGVIVQTAEGYEALACSGLPERMLYPEIPADLSPRPTLSVLTRSDRRVTATVQLTYMAQGFDWSASYVARADTDSGKIALFAWLTLANGGAQTFPDARLQVVARQPKRERSARPPKPSNPALHLKCWPMDITSTHPRHVFSRLPWPAEEERSYEALADIVVTAQRRGRPAIPMPPPPPAPAPVAMVAEQEDLGDLKLYRVPERVTVSAQGQKQVAMIEKPSAVFERIYAANVSSGSPDYRPMPFLLRGRNSVEKGLGVPLPAGAVTIFETIEGNDLLVGSADLADLAVNERVEFPIGQSPDVQWRLTKVKESRKRQDWRVELTNARPVPVRAEIIVPFDLAERLPGTERGQGGWVLPVTVPENGSASLSYTVKLERR